MLDNLQKVPQKQEISMSHPVFRTTKYELYIFPGKFLIILLLKLYDNVRIDKVCTKHVFVIKFGVYSLLKKIIEMEINF